MSHEIPDSPPVFAVPKAEKPPEVVPPITIRQYAAVAILQGLLAGGEQHVRQMTDPEMALRQAESGVQVSEIPKRGMNAQELIGYAIHLTDELLKRIG